MKTKKCKNCAYYFSYYRQLIGGYSKQNNGYCRRHKIIQMQNDSCENFKDNGDRELMKDKSLQRYLEQAFISLNEIAQILKEREMKHNK